MEPNNNEEWADLVRAQVAHIDSLTLALSEAQSRIGGLLVMQAGLVEALKYARDWLAGQDGNAMLIAMNSPDVKAAFAKMDLALSKVTP